MSFWGFLNGKMFDSNGLSPSERGGAREGACPSRRAGCGGQRPLVKACSKYERKK